jgi:hypothetical protein
MRYYGARKTRQQLAAEREQSARVQQETERSEFNREMGFQQEAKNAATGYGDVSPDDIDPSTNRPYRGYSSPSLDDSFHRGEMDID